MSNYLWESIDPLPASEAFELLGEEYDPAFEYRQVTEEECTTLVGINPDTEEVVWHFLDEEEGEEPTFTGIAPIYISSAILLLIAIVVGGIIIWSNI